MTSWRSLLCDVFQVAEQVAEEAIPFEDFNLPMVQGFDPKFFVVIPSATHELLIESIAAVQEFEAEEVEDAEHF